jgi:hypothetical protein
VQKELRTKLNVTQERGELHTFKEIHTGSVTKYMYRENENQIRDLK